MRPTFVKSQALGNDFIIIEDIEERYDFQSANVRHVCDRHFGIGADGLMVIRPSTVAEFYMLFFNPDGSKAEMCGNGIRCFVSYLYNHGLISKPVVKVETGGGLREVFLILEQGKLEAVRVNMGRPAFNTADIPMDVEQHEFINEALSTDRIEAQATCLSVGNPHCVIFVDDLSEVPVEKQGPQIEKLALFPNRVNVEFVQVIKPDEIKVRVWERGAGETLACGTGACASVLAGVRNKLVSRRAKVCLPGGCLDVEWADDDFVFLTGSSEEVFRGEFNLERF
jgi:diaminopimelate epimerase